ncbi:MAG: hypothetical protein D6698_15875 [Gammaproteobacteria bacterium]|nr:MAG: hypothetical protein D6698_15875 [Gammaproteobacteria bacterium]
MNQKEMKTKLLEETKAFAQEIAAEAEREARDWNEFSRILRDRVKLYLADRMAKSLDRMAKKREENEDTITYVTALASLYESVAPFIAASVKTRKFK